MDRATHIQIDRIETKQDKLIEGIGVLMNLESADIIVSFLDEEVYKNEGRLKHLNQDVELRKLYEELKEDADDEEEAPQQEEVISSDTKEEYRQNVTPE